MISSHYVSVVTFFEYLSKNRLTSSINSELSLIKILWLILWNLFYFVNCFRNFFRIILLILAYIYSFLLLFKIKDKKSYSANSIRRTIIILTANSSTFAYFIFNFASINWQTFISGQFIAPYIKSVFYVTHLIDRYFIIYT